LAWATAAAQSTDPLPSWKEGKTKQSILDFVAEVTRKDSPRFVPVAERIATFDNDGTLWAEQPLYFQLAFAIDQVKAEAGKHPEWKDKEPFKSLIAGDVRAALAGGEHAVMEIVAATHSGTTTEEFERVVGTWLAEARHPKTGRRYTEMVYQPMLELLSYLRANGFRTFIVSGGGSEFMRAFAEKVYGIPPDQVIGSTGKLKYELHGSTPVLMKLPAVNFVDDKDGKPIAIHRHIGRRPIAAFGNSDGDLQMLQWTASGSGARLSALVHHTDAEREWAYDRASSIGRLDKGLDEAEARGWPVIDMKEDWRIIYPFQKKWSRPHGGR
jgi:phosphoglycolate phosphatase-like HAD superfamily hydrolase